MNILQVYYSYFLIVFTGYAHFKINVFNRDVILKCKKAMDSHSKNKSIDRVKLICSHFSCLSIVVSEKKKLSSIASRSSSIVHNKYYIFSSCPRLYFMEVFTLQFDVFVLLFSLAFTLSHSQPLFLLLFSQDCFCSVTKKKIDCFCSVSVLYSLTLSLFLLVYIHNTSTHPFSLFSHVFGLCINFDSFDLN